jgi:hypothetical protein
MSDQASLDTASTQTVQPLQIPQNGQAPELRRIMTDSGLIIALVVFVAYL